MNNRLETELTNVLAKEAKINSNIYSHYFLMPTTMYPILFVMRFSSYNNYPIPRDDLEQLYREALTDTMHYEWFAIYYQWIKDEDPSQGVYSLFSGHMHIAEYGKSTKKL